jgi:hypothetical protein
MYRMDSSTGPAGRAVTVTNFAQRGAELEPDTTKIQGGANRFRGGVMNDKTCWESFKAEGAGVIEKLKSLIHEGNVRRIVIQHQGRTVAEFPLTAGVVGVMLAPVVAAIGAIVALLKDCTIQVERMDAEDKPSSDTKTSAGVG